MNRSQLFGSILPRHAERLLQKWMNGDSLDIGSWP